MTTVAFITSQDGSYLAEFLLKKNYDVSFFFLVSVIAEMVEWDCE